MKKLMIIALLALGFSQEVMPMYAKIAAKATQWGMSKAVVGSAVVNAALFGAFSSWANKPMVDAITNPEFQEAIGMKQPTTWLPYLWHNAKWFYSEFGAAIGIISMLGGAANMAKGAVSRHASEQEVSEQAVDVRLQGQPSHPGHLAQIHPQYKEFLKQRAVAMA